MYSEDQLALLRRMRLRYLGIAIWCFFAIVVVLFLYVGSPQLIVQILYCVAAFGFMAIGVFSLLSRKAVNELIERIENV